MQSYYEREAMIIRLLQQSDTESLFKFESDNKNWFQKFVPPRPESYFEKDSFSEVIKDLIEEQQNRECFLYLMIEDGNIVGRVNISEINGLCGEIGFRISKDSAGKGFTTAAVKLLMEKAVNSHGLSEFNAKTTSVNTASQAVLKKCGFTFTHEIKNAGILNNESIDFYCYRLDLEC